MKTNMPTSRVRTNKKNWRWFLTPMQLKTQGQWLSSHICSQHTRLFLVISWSREDSLVMFRHTSRASLAMLGPQWHPHHALDAEALGIVFPQGQQIFNHRFLLRYARKLRYVAWIVQHADHVKIYTKAQSHGK